MPWQQFVMELGALDPETVAARLVEFGACSVTFSDAGGEPILEPAPGEMPLWQQTRITALFDGKAELDELPAALSRALGTSGLPQHSLATLADRVWEREWHKDFGPMRFGESLWVCPRGVRADDPEAAVVELDPGLAFGTGTHATTALCLNWLDSLDLAGQSIIDYGAGSGILAIAALKLGASRALAFDIDPQAVAASRRNAAINGVAERLIATRRTPDPGTLADVVVANILAEPLIELAKPILDLTITGGKLALSGILPEQTAALVNAYSGGVRFDPPVAQNLDGQTWVRLTGSRK